MKYVLVTGVSTGIGNSISSYLLSKGYFVFGTVRKSSDAFELSKEYPDRFQELIMDVTDNPTIKSSLAQVKSKLGNERLNVLINNAGYALPGPISLLSDEELHQQMNVNVYGIQRVTNAFLPLLGTDPSIKAKPGKIINISSISGLFNSPFNGAYCISKHAVESLTDIYRRELLYYGIDVIAIQPGPFKSEIWDKNMGAMDKYAESDYGFLLHKANKMISNAKKNALDPILISKLIEKIIESPKPKSRYMLHKNKLVFKLFRLLPDRMIDKIVWKSLNKKNTKSYRPV